MRSEERRGRHRVTVAWIEPDGTRRTGEFTARRGTGAGDRLTVWAGPGTVSNVPPQTRSRTVARTVAAGAGAAPAVALPLLGLYRLVRRGCDRRRHRLWDAEWARFDNPRIGP
ncbi:hypothetical protein [Actinomadura sp. GTD37]|uniref:hypothetical protein n=1 Tax=Actinomadura sp. GTD37 TaxID=1778030 RepID=UPI0035BF0BE7